MAIEVHPVVSRFRRGSAVLLAALALAANVVAQDTPPDKGKLLGEVTLFGEEAPMVQAATKTEIPISKAPSSVTVISAKQIRESGARTIPDLLRLVAGVNVRWNPMVQTLDVRGFGEYPFSNRLLILIDGAPYNSPDTGGFPLSPALDPFPVQLVKRIELVRGPGSALYGENAFWGVLNIITLTGDDLRGGNVELLAGDRDTRVGTASFGTKIGDASILGSAKWQQTQFPVEFWLDQESKIKASDLFLKGTWNGLSVSAYRHDENLDGFALDLSEDGLPPGTAFRSADHIKQTMEAATVKYNYGPSGAPFSFDADVSWQHRDGMHCAGCHAAQEDPHFQKRADHGYQLLGDFRLGVHLIPSHDILVGVEGRKLDRGDHEAELSPDGAIVSGYDKWAAYMQDQISLLDDSLHVVLGVRYDASTDLFDSKTSPRFAVVWNPTEKLVLRSGYGTAFRFPNFSELYQDSWFLGADMPDPIPDFPLAVFAPNPNLVPEEIRSFDLGGEYFFGGGVSARIDLYRQKVKRFMVMTQVLAPPPNPAGIRVENHPGEATITGGEIEVRANLAQGITGFVNYAHQTEDQDDSKVDSNFRKMEFVYAPENKINLGAYLGPWNGVRGAVEVSWRDEYEAPSFWFVIFGQQPKPLPSYTLLNARLSWDIPWEVPGLAGPIRLSVIGSNLLDKQVKETLLGADATIAGREFFGQVDFRF